MPTLFETDIQRNNRQAITRTKYDPIDCDVYRRHQALLCYIIIFNKFLTIWSYFNYPLSPYMRHEASRCSENTPVSKFVTIGSSSNKPSP